MKVDAGAVHPLATPHHSVLPSIVTHSHSNLVIIYLFVNLLNISETTIHPSQKHGKNYKIGSMWIILIIDYLTPKRGKLRSIVNRLF